MNLSRRWRFCVVASILIGATSASAAEPAPDAKSVRVIERKREGETGLALPDKLPGCQYLGKVSVQVPEGAVASPYRGVPPEIVDRLRLQAAKKGGNTVAVLPGMRVDGNHLRGTAFQCEPGSPPER